MAVLPVIECDWNLPAKQARAVQRSLLTQVRIHPPAHPIRLIAGADTSYNRGSNRIAGAVVVWDLETGNVVETQTAVVDTPFPYVPGLLTFREAPALMPAFGSLETEPDLIMFNGHGTAHPLRFGLACHLGVVFDRPAMGVAQKRLCGAHDPVGAAPGDEKAVMLDNSQIGVVVRTRARCNPIYISPGHRIDPTSALALTLRSTGGYKLPAPIREAHALANKVRRAFTVPKDSE